MTDWRNWMADRRLWSAVLLVVGLIGGGWIAASAAPDSGMTGGLIPAPREGFLAPSFELADPSGQTFRLVDLRGQVVVVNFWASWCPPCKAEMPDLAAAYQSHREEGLVILGVNTTYQDDAQTAIEFAKAQGVTFPILLDQRGEVARQYLVSALPTTYFIDRQGIIRKVVVGGPMSETTLTSTVRDLLQAVP
jgi:cytochrome c biogenesis protein CcmG/thiol:disulfide interchange protein DsbE